MSESGTLTPIQRQQAGHAARRLLDFGLRGKLGDRGLGFIIEVVCWTGDTDRQDTLRVLRRCLEPDIVASCGYDYLPTIAKHLPRIVDLDPGFAESLIDVLFSHEPEPRDAVVSGGRIMAFSIQKRDLHSMAEHYIAEHFERIITSTPVTAAHVLLAVVGGLIRYKVTEYSKAEKRMEFSFRGKQAVFVPDGSYLWGGEHSHRITLPIRKMLDAFEKRLVQLAESDSNTVGQILDVFRDRNQWGFLWNQLLSAGLRSPNHLVPHLSDLLFAPPILASFETRVNAGRLLSASYSLLSQDTRLTIEQSIMEIPASTESGLRDKYGNERRDRLLGCLPVELIASVNAQRRRQEVDAAGGAPPNTPVFEMGGFHAISDDEWLRSQGVLIDELQNADFRSSLQPLTEFTRDKLNAELSIEEIRAFLPAVQAFEGRLQTVSENGVDARLSADAMHTVYACCALMCRCPSLDKGQPEYAYVRQKMLEAAKDLVPTFASEIEKQWDDGFPAWGSPSPRIDAAKGLLFLARRPGSIDDEIVQAIKSLAQDPVAPVRHQIASFCIALWNSDRTTFWDLATQFSEREERYTILKFFMHEVVLRLPAKDVQRIESLVNGIYERFRPNAAAGEVRSACVVFYVRRALWDKDTASETLLEQLLTSPLNSMPELTQICSLSRDLMAFADPNTTSEEHTRVRRWTFDFLRRIFIATTNELDALRGPLKKSGRTAVPEDTAKAFRSLAHLQEHIATQVYFASGAYEDSQQKRPAEESDSMTKLGRFFDEGFSLLETMATASISRVAYDLLKTFHYVHRAEPKRVFFLIGELVRSARKDGFHYEVMAADLIVEIVEQYLAERRAMFRADKEMLNTLLDVLDLFVEAGWPKALNLAYRLDEVFRG